FDAAALEGHLYAIGGWNVEGDQDHATFTETMAVYDGAVWTSEACPVHRRALAVVATTQGIAAIGGLDASLHASRAVDLFDPATPAIGWTDLSFPGRVRNRFAIFATDDSVYVLGGNDSPEQHDFAPTNFVAETFRLHVPSLRWFPLAPLPEARQSMESVVVGD